MKERLRTLAFVKRIIEYSAAQIPLRQNSNENISWIEII